MIRTDMPVANALASPASQLATSPAAPQIPPQLEPSRGAAAGTAPEAELKEVFQQFVGETFFGQLIKAMRQTVDKPAYMHGGRGEEVFQAQLDQVLTEHMTEASADTISEPMYELFMLRR